MLKLLLYIFYSSLSRMLNFKLLIHNKIINLICFHRYSYFPPGVTASSIETSEATCLSPPQRHSSGTQSSVRVMPRPLGMSMGLCLPTSREEVSPYPTNRSLHRGYEQVQLPASLRFRVAP